MFGLELIDEQRIIDEALLDSLMQGNGEIIAITDSSIKTSRKMK